MKGISISLIELVIKGIPESLLIILALHLYTHTKINLKKYFALSIVYLILTYLIRMLPIHLGVNTMLSILVIIILFQVVYKGQLEKATRLLISSIAILLIIMLSESLNVLLLMMLFGREKMVLLLSDADPLRKCINTIPSTVFTAIFIFAGQALLAKYEKRKVKNGEAGK